LVFIGACGVARGGCGGRALVPSAAASQQRARRPPMGSLPWTGRGPSSMSHSPYHRRASPRAPPPAPGFRFAPLGHGEEETCASAALSEAGACPLARAGQARSRPPQDATTSTILSHTITLSSQHHNIIELLSSTHQQEPQSATLRCSRPSARHLDGRFLSPPAPPGGRWARSA
jgi:hypothetical protein